MGGRTGASGPVQELYSVRDRELCRQLKEECYSDLCVNRSHSQWDEAKQVGPEGSEVRLFFAMIQAGSSNDGQGEGAHREGSIAKAA